MEHDQIKARIYGNTLGSMADLILFFEDIDEVYNNFVAFNKIVESKKEKQKEIEEKLNKIEKIQAMENRCEFIKDIKEIINNEFNSFKFEDFKEFKYNRYSRKIGDFKGEEIYISKVQFNSPGFWEVIVKILSNINPMQNISEYLDKRFNRKRDRELNWDKEKKLGTLAVEEKELDNKLKALVVREKTLNIVKDELKFIKESSQLLEEIGYNKHEIKTINDNLLIESLSLLDRHIEAGRLIDIEIINE